MYVYVEERFFNVVEGVRIIARSRDNDLMPMSDVAFESSLDGNIIDGKYVKQRKGGKHANIEWRLAA
jgi:hypothetical protein